MSTTKKTSISKTALLLALATGIFSVTVAFTQIQFGTPRVVQVEEGEMKKEHSLPNWVHDQLDNAHALIHFSDHCPVIVRLQIDQNRQVHILSCDSNIPALKDFVEARLQGQYVPSVDAEYFNTYYEIKLNFRHT